MFKKIISRIKSKRFVIAIIFAIFLAIITVIALFKDMEYLSATSVGGLFTIITTYIIGQTKRPSNYEGKN